MVTEAFIRAQFAPWETENPMPFFEKIPDNVSWIVGGTVNPLRGHYHSKAEVLTVYGQLMSKFAGPTISKITNILPSGDSAVIEMTSHGVSKAGVVYDLDLCWICRYENGVCVAVKLYQDTAAEKQLFEEF
jgi:ketosteroid isomerase-like protein